ncbi:MAG: hypothetical protein WCI54_05455 [Bacteroidia bacterium]|jgi:hypothetical protein
MKQLSLVIWSLLLLVILNGCNLDGLDFNKLSTETSLSPEIVAPVAKANITVWDLLKSVNQGPTDITKDPGTGLVRIVYKQNDLFKYKVSDFLSFPPLQSFTSGDKELGVISPGNISVSRNITLSELAGTLAGGLETITAYDGMTVPFPANSYPGPAAVFNVEQSNEYTSITLSGGNLEVTLENKLKVPVTLTGSLYDSGNNQKITDFTFSNIAANGTSVKTVSLSGIRLSNKVEFRILTFETSGSTLPVNINLKDYIKLTFGLKDLKISNGNLMVKSQVLQGFSGILNFVFPEPDMKAYAMVLKSGKMIIKTTNKSKLSGAMNFTLNEIKMNGVPVSANIPFDGSSTSIDLTGAVVNFATDPTQLYNRIPYSYSLQLANSIGYVDYSSTDILKMDITLDKLAYQSIHGDFGKRQVQIDPGSFNMNLDMLNKITGNFKLVNPMLEMIIHNSIGMPASVNMNFNGSNKEGKTEALNPPAFDVPFPGSTDSGTVTKSIICDKQNSNVVNFIALPPTGQISYGGKIDFNKGNEVTLANPNFIVSDSNLAVDLALNLPMELQISNLSFKDTSAISGSDYDKIESVDLILNSTNGIPLDVEMQLFFIDTISKTQLGLSKKVKILKAAELDAKGAIVPVKSSQTFSLDQSEMGSLRKANGIVFSGTVNSPSGGTGVASILSDSKIDLNVVIKTKVNL